MFTRPQDEAAFVVNAGPSEELEVVRKLANEVGMQSCLG